MAGDFNTGGGDPFSAFWTDFWSKAGVAPSAAAAGGTPSFGPELMERWRKAFFEALSRSSEEYLRSDAFLRMMKQSMDQSLTWQQAINQQVQQGLAAAQMVSRADVDHLVSLLRGLEERLMHRLDALENRHAAAADEQERVERAENE